MAGSNPEIVVVGGGLVGLVSALAIADALKTSGGEVVLIAPLTKTSDKRTTAMLMPSVRLLQRLDAWGDLQSASAALQTMRIIDASQRIVTAPPVEFRASEIDEAAFGYNVPNDQANNLLRHALAQRTNVTIVDAHAVSLDAASCGLTLDNGNVITGDLFVAADGGNSLLRSEVGIKVRQWSYPQTAIVTTFSHALPHDGVSTELHTRTGPFTQVPLPATEDAKYRSSLVWVVAQQEADQLLLHNKEWLAGEIENRLQSSLGKVAVETDLQQFPLSGMTARQFAVGKTILVGEAAHVLPPIGAQGFNLGVSDIQTLADLIADQTPVDRISDLYNRRRRAEILAKTGGIDLLNRSLLTSFLPTHLTRSLALGALSESSQLRKLLMTSLMNGPLSLFSRGKDRLAEFRS